MVRRGLASGPERAQLDIEAGRVLVGGAVADKASRLVSTAEAIVIQGVPPPFVSRGGVKLFAALGEFGVDPQGLRVLDAGASTGGFTDCLLQHGAAEVIAVDVGYGQLHERVSRDPRVLLLDRTNIRELTPDRLGGLIDMAVVDLSFISLTLVIDSLVACCRPGANMIALVKPQFEAGKLEADKGKGIITSPEVWRRVLREVIAAFVDRKAAIMGVMVSPLTGADGNVEFLLHAVAPPRPAAVALAPRLTPFDESLLALIDTVVATAVRRRSREA